MSFSSLQQLQDAGVELVSVLDKGKKEVSVTVRAICPSAASTSPHPTRTKACDRAIERDLRLLCEEALDPSSPVDPRISTVIMISSDYDFAPAMRKYRCV